MLTSPFSFFASASSITRCEATPVFADVDPATFNLDPAAVQRALHEAGKVAAIMPVHLYGQCADMDDFAAIAKQYSLDIIEDAAQAFGASWNGRKAGTLGTAAAFSFYPTKNLSAFGDGGAVSTNDPELADHVRRLRNHGSRQRYYHEEIGWNSRLDAIQAAVLRIKLRHIDQWNLQRRAIAVQVRRALRLDRLGEDRGDDRFGTGSGGAAADSPGGLPRLPPIRRASGRGGKSFAASSASMASGARSTTQCRCTCSRASPTWATRPETSRSPSAPLWKRWLYPSSPSCGRTSRSGWSGLSLSSTAGRS